MGIVHFMHFNEGIVTVGGVYTTPAMRVSSEHFRMHTHQFLENQPDKVKEFRLKFIEERVKMVRWNFLRAVFVNAESLYGLQQTLKPSVVYQKPRQFLLSVYVYYEVIRTHEPVEIFVSSYVLSCLSFWKSSMLNKRIKSVFGRRFSRLCNYSASSFSLLVQGKNS